MFLQKRIEAKREQIERFNRWGQLVMQDAESMKDLHAALLTAPFPPDRKAKAKSKGRVDNYNGVVLNILLSKVRAEQDLDSLLTIQRRANAAGKLPAFIFTLLKKRS